MKKSLLLALAALSVLAPSVLADPVGTVDPNPDPNPDPAPSCGTDGVAQCPPIVSQITTAICGTLSGTTICCIFKTYRYQCYPNEAWRYVTHVYSAPYGTCQTTDSGLHCMDPVTGKPIEKVATASASV